MRQRQLAMLLSSLPAHPCGRLELEQYSTPGDIAASWLSQIATFGDMTSDSTIVDLGAGNGVLGIGAALMGIEQVLLIELDEDACKSAFQSIEQAGVTENVELVMKNVNENLDLSGVDLIISNPPWGTQVAKSDRPFFDTILRSNAICHLMHSAKATHIEPIFESKGWTVNRYWETEYPLPAVYAHHSSRRGRTKVAFWRLKPPE